MLVILLSVVNNFDNSTLTLAFDPNSLTILSVVSRPGTYLCVKLVKIALEL